MAGLADLAAQVRVQYCVVCCRCALSGRLVIEWAEWLVLWVPSTATGILVNAKLSEPNQERCEIVGYREQRSLVGPVRLDSGDSVGFTLRDVIIVRRTGARLSALPRRERRQGWCRTSQDSCNGSSPRTAGKAWRSMKSLYVSITIGWCGGSGWLALA